jgi:hypothetical protein
MPDDDHAYNDPNLSALQFLLCVMHSPEVDLADRIRAADAAIPYVALPPRIKWEDLDPMDRTVIVVQAADLTPQPVRQYTGSRPNDLLYRILDPHPHQKRWTN